MTPTDPNELLIPQVFVFFYLPKEFVEMVPIILKGHPGLSDMFFPERW